MVFTNRSSRILTTLLMALALTMLARGETVTREDAKKTLTHAMLENTTWPNEQALDAFVLGLYGGDRELQRVLVEYMAAQRVRGKPIVVTAYESLEAARAANILLIANSENARLAEIREALHQSHTLVVTDRVADTANIMVNFTHPTRIRVAFELNAGNIIAAGLVPSREMLMFAGAKRDVAELHKYTEAKLEQVEGLASERQQRLEEQQQRLEEQQRLLNEQREMLEQGATLDSQRTEVEANQRKLVNLQGQLGDVQQLLMEGEARLDENAAELAEKQRILTEKEAQLENYSQQIESNLARLATQEPASIVEAAQIPEPGSEAVSQLSIAENQRSILFAVVGVLLLLLVLTSLVFLAYRRKLRLAAQLEDKALKLGAANEKLLQMTEAESRCVLEAADRLEGTGLKNSQDDCVSLITRSAETLLGVSNDISDLSRAEAGGLDLESIPFTLRDVLGDTLQPLALQAGEKGLELTFHIPPDIPDSLIGDPTRLRQVLDNLVGNAIKFTDAGEVAVDLQLESGVENAVRVRFEVRDTGTGIAPEQQEKVFEVFNQVDPGVTGRLGGAGLGLALSSQLAQMMGSQLSVRSVLDEGSTFYFSADFQLPDEPAPAAPKPLRALVVDDNSTNRMILEELLDSWGMSVTVADGGETALEELTRVEEAGDSFALALVDVMMPHMDGFELSTRIRERPAQQSMRILMLTSKEQPDTEEQRKRLDISSVLLKPTKHSELRAAITDALGISGEAVGRPEQREAANVGSHKVRLVTDSSANRKVATEMLGKRGEQAKVAANSGEAVESVSAEVPEEQATTDKSEPQPARDELPCLDWSGALRNLEGDEDFLVELTEKFLDQYPGMLARIEEAVATEEGDELRRAAHAVKGPAQLVGAIAASETALRLENLGHMDNFFDAAEELGELQANLVELEAALIAELPERKNSGGFNRRRRG